MKVTFKRKRLLSVLLALAMVITILPMAPATVKAEAVRGRFFDKMPIDRYTINIDMKQDSDAYLEVGVYRTEGENGTGELKKRVAYKSITYKKGTNGVSLTLDISRELENVVVVAKGSQLKKNSISKITCVGDKEVADPNPLNKNSSWTIEYADGKTATPVKDGNTYTFNNIKSGKEWYNDQMYSNDFRLVAGLEYKLIFKAKITGRDNVNFQFVVQEHNGDWYKYVDENSHWLNYNIWNQQKDANGYIPYEITFTATKTIDNVRVVFGFGKSNVNGDINFTLKNANIVRVDAQVNIDDDNQSSGGNTQPDNGGTTPPGDNGGTQPGNGGTTPPGDNGTQPGNGGSTQPGNGGSTQPGNDGSTQPGNGGSTQPGNGGSTQPDNGSTQPDNGSTQPDNGSQPGNGGNTQPDNGSTQPEVKPDDSKPSDNTTPGSDTPYVNQDADKLDNEITGVKDVYNKTIASKPFVLKAYAKGANLSFVSSDSEVVDVDVMSGKVTIVGCGVATITINAFESDSYKSVSRMVTINVLPAKVKGLSVKSINKNSLILKWKSQRDVTGYQIQVSTSSKFTAKKTKTVKVAGAYKASKVVSKLKANKLYFVRVRGYKAIGGKQIIYGAWSKVVSKRVVNN